MGVRDFKFWCHKVLPAVYDDSLSYYELICKLVKKINDVIAELNAQGEGIAELQAAVAELNAMFEMFKEHGFEQYYEEQLEQWMIGNAERIVTLLARQVYFGLTLDGYFVAYVPDSWDDVIFDTGAVYGEPEYGRLILRMDVDSPHHVEQ